MTDDSLRKIKDDDTKTTQLFPSNDISHAQYFAIIKNKYDANTYENSSPTSLLYLILRKAELGIELNKFDLNWLKEQQLFSTLDCLALKQYQSQEKNRLETELNALKTKYKVRADFKFNIDNPLYSILWKLEAGESPQQSEINYLKYHQLAPTLEIVEKIQEFVDLKVKYCSTQYQDNFPNSRLYQILKKIDSSTRLTEDDIKWLTENKLLETLEFFNQQEATRNLEFLQLKEKYGLTEHLDNSWFSPLYWILKKIETDACLTTDDLQWLKQNGTACKQFAESEEQKQDFIELKRKFLATQYQEDNPSNPLYGILKKIETCQQLKPTDIEFIKKCGLSETVKLAEKVSHFAKLKKKYQADAPQETSPESHLYKILQDLDSKHQITESQLNNLKVFKQHKTAELAREITEFTSLREKYKATKHSNFFPSSRLYKILRNFDIKMQTTDADIQWLEENHLSDTSTYLAYLLKTQHFKFLKLKYRMVGPHLPFDPFYEIMCKLEKGERLDEVLVTKLMAEEKLWSGGEIVKAHYRQEAQFHEKEYERTKDIYLVPTISSEWRKAEKPEKALAITEKANIETIKDKHLKARICVTRGAAFRDIGDLEQAKKFALIAIECQPDSHHPYTLMGAICYDEYRYPEGDEWFEKARERGADVEEEIQRYVKRIKDKDKQRKAAEYLVKKDSFVYAWAKVYLEKGSAG
ncbi:MAG TPA: hypothetical protein V6D13_19805 [Halomicronema sp.]